MRAHSDVEQMTLTPFPPRRVDDDFILIPFHPPIAADVVDHVSDHPSSILAEDTHADLHNSGDERFNY